MESVGFALAVVPLLISAAEHASDVARVWSRFRNHGLEIDQHVLMLKTQRAKFKHDLVGLVASCVGHSQAVEMFRDNDHPAWKNPEFEWSLIFRIRNDQTLFLDLLRLIDERLRHLERRSLNLLNSVPRSDDQAKVAEDPKQAVGLALSKNTYQKIG